MSRRLATAAPLLTALLLAVLPTGSAATAQDGWRGADRHEVLRPRPPAAEATGPAQRQDDGRGRGLEEGPWPAREVDLLKRDGQRAVPAIDPLAPTIVQPGAPRPAVVSSFPGLDRGESGGSFPPDTSIAVAPGRLVQVVNTYARLFDRDGTALDTAPLQELLGVPSVAGVFDPKVHWDPFGERFVAVVLDRDVNTQRSWVHLSVSRGAEPATLTPADWCNYTINGELDGSWADYPGLGLNDRWIAVSVNNFRFSGGFLVSRLMVFDRSPLQGTLSSCPDLGTFLFDLERDSGGNQVFNPQPVQHHDASAGDALFAVASDFGRGDTYTLWRISSKNGKPRLADEIVDSGAYQIPPNATQPGGLELDTGDNRVMQQASYRDGVLWLAHSTACAPKGANTVLSCVRAVRMAPGASGEAEVTFEQTLGKKNEYYFWPGVVIDEDGDVVVAALRAGATRFLETVVFGMKAKAARFTEPLAKEKFGRVRVAEPGICTPINVSRNSFGEAVARSGDYLGLALDPASEDIWVSGEHGATNIVGGCIWATDLVRIRF